MDGLVNILKDEGSPTYPVRENFSEEEFEAIVEKLNLKPFKDYMDERRWLEDRGINVPNDKWINGYKIGRYFKNFLFKSRYYKECYVEHPFLLFEKFFSLLEDFIRKFLNIRDGKISNILFILEICLEEDRIRETYTNKENMIDLKEICEIMEEIRSRRNSIVHEPVGKCVNTVSHLEGCEKMVGVVDLCEAFLCRVVDLHLPWNISIKRNIELYRMQFDNFVNNTSRRIIDLRKREPKEKFELLVKSFKGKNKPKKFNDFYFLCSCCGSVLFKGKDVSSISTFRKDKKVRNVSTTRCYVSTRGRLSSLTKGAKERKTKREGSEWDVFCKTCDKILKKEDRKNMEEKSEREGTKVNVSKTLYRNEVLVGKVCKYKNSAENVYKFELRKEWPREGLRGLEGGDWVFHRNSIVVGWKKSGRVDGGECETSFLRDLEKRENDKNILPKKLEDSFNEKFKKRMRIFQREKKYGHIYRYLENHNSEERKKVVYKKWKLNRSLRFLSTKFVNRTKSTKVQEEEEEESENEGEEVSDKEEVDRLPTQRSLLEKFIQDKEEMIKKFESEIKSMKQKIQDLDVEERKMKEKKVKQEVVKGSEGEEMNSMEKGVDEHEELRKEKQGNVEVCVPSLSDLTSPSLETPVSVDETGEGEKVEKVQKTSSNRVRNTGNPKRRKKKKKKGRQKNKKKKKHHKEEDNDPDNLDEFWKN